MYLYPIRTYKVAAHKIASRGSRTSKHTRGERECKTLRVPRVPARASHFPLSARKISIHEELCDTPKLQCLSDNPERDREERPPGENKYAIFVLPLASLSKASVPSVYWEKTETCEGNFRAIFVTCVCVLLLTCWMIRVWMKIETVRHEYHNCS